MHSGCESVANMTAAPWFVLPPLQAHYYRQNNAAYRSLPPRKPRCGTGLADSGLAGSNFADSA